MYSIKKLLSRLRSKPLTATDARNIVFDDKAVQAHLSKRLSSIKEAAKAKETSLGFSYNSEETKNISSEFIDRIANELHALGFEVHRQGRALNIFWDSPKNKKESIIIQNSQNNRELID